MSECERTTASRAIEPQVPRKLRRSVRCRDEGAAFARRREAISLAGGKCRPAPAQPWPDAQKGAIEPMPVCNRVAAVNPAAMTGRRHATHQRNARGTIQFSRQ